MIIQKTIKYGITDELSQKDLEMEAENSNSVPKQWALVTFGGDLWEGEWEYVTDLIKVIERPKEQFGVES
eukprot:gene56376-75272_t